MVDLLTTSFKPPKEILPNLFAFPPNRKTLGGTSYLIVGKTDNILIDCPSTDTSYYEDFLKQQGGIKWLVITHRGGITSGVKILQTALDCQVLIQEQEAYLLPEVAVTSFEQTFAVNSSVTAIWMPGHSPGTCCVYWQANNGVLFTGRHLLPNQQGIPVPLRFEKTFHWPRQLQSVAHLKSRFTSDTLSYICPGANTGFLRGKGYIDDAYHHLSTLDTPKL
ncbi:MAG: MBL fold metallo-hydrolase [Microcystaceae cyanobacterium]